VPEPSTDDRAPRRRGARPRSKVKTPHANANHPVFYMPTSRTSDLTGRQRWLVLVGEAALLIAVALALLWPAPIHSNDLPAADASSDIMISHWPSALLLKRTISLEHRLPLWNPYYAGGRPLAADPLAAIFYPPTQLVNLVPSIRDYYLFLLLGHLVLAGAGTMLLARRAFRMSRWAALVAAVSFMATPRLISHLGAGHVTLVQTVAWYPWLALGCWATVRNPRRWAAPFGVVLALTTLAGHPQMAYYGMLMTAVIALWLLWSRWRANNSRQFVAPLVGLAVAGAAGLLLASIHLVPLLEFTKRSTRQQTIAATDAYPLTQFIKALFGHPPRSPVPWENVVQPGGLVLLLAVLGAIAAGRRSLPLLGGIVLVGALAMGNATPLFHLAAKVLPEFGGFRGLSRIWLVALLGIALLAGWGADTLLGVMHSYHPRHLHRGQLLVGFVTLLLVTVTLLKVDYGRAQVSSVTTSITPSPLEQTVAQLAGSSRVYGVQRNLPQLGAVTLNLRLADGWDPLLLENYVKFMSQAGGYKINGYQLTIPPVDDGKPNPKLLGLMHVGIVVSRTKLNDPALVEIKTVQDTHIYRNQDDAGPAYLVKPGANGAPPTLNQLQQIPSGVTITRLSREEDRFGVTSTEAAYLVVADPSYPGWVATLDGKPAKIELIDGVLPAIKVAPGTHELVYHYAPTSVKVGAGLSLAGLLLTLIGLLFGWTRWLDWPRGRVRTNGQTMNRSAPAKHPGTKKVKELIG